MNKVDLIKEIKEIVEVIKVCPQNLQEKCFEILLSNLLIQKKKPSNQISDEIDVIDKPEDILTNNISGDISKRIKTFIGQYSLSPECISKVFQVDESGVSIEVTDLKAKKASQKQRRLALLIGVKHQFTEGSFDVPVDELREMCVTYGIYDAANFAANIKNFKEIFAGFKVGAKNKLSPVGKKEAADLIKELSS